MRPEIDGDDWVEGVPGVDIGPIEIITIGTLTDPEALPQVRRYYRLLSQLPTEEGTVIGIGDWRLVRLAPYEPGLPGTWEMLPIPKAVQASVGAAGARMQCVYSDDWVRAEVEQQGGFKVLAEPRSMTTEALLGLVRAYVPNIDRTLDRVAREFGAAS